MASPARVSGTAVRGAPVDLAALGELTPISRSGGQGRVFAPEQQPRALAAAAVVKLYRSRPAPPAAHTLAAMVAWGRGLEVKERWQLHRLAAWPLATVSARGELAGIVMQDVRPRFELPFLMPSGRVAQVMLQLEHLLGPDDYLRQRGLPITLDTYTRAAVAERICAAFAYLHSREIVVSDVSPSNMLIAFASAGPEVSFIDCDSMVFRGHQALSSVETSDWQMPSTFAERPLTRAADAYKLGLIVLRLFARSCDARELGSHAVHVPVDLRPLLVRALAGEASNRPPASEWQLALRGAIADRRLTWRYPGPRPRVRTAPRRVPRVAAEHPAAARVAAIASGVPAAAHASPGGRALGPERGFSQGFTVAWLVAGVLMLILFFHLLQAAAGPQGPSLGGASSARPTLGGGYVYINPQGEVSREGPQGEEDGTGEGTREGEGEGSRGGIER